MQTEGPSDLSPLLGSWTNTKHDSNHFVRVDLRLDDHGRLHVHPFGATDDGPSDWGEAVAEPVVAGPARQAIGFHACFSSEERVHELAANVKLGILVIQSYSFFRDGSGRAGYYAREFFHR